MAQTQEIVVGKSRQEWAAIINADWRKSIESIIQTGRDLIAAKDDLPNGQFGEMVRADLDFAPRVAQQLMQIAEHPQIGNANCSSHLPTSWTTLYQLSRLSSDDFVWATRRGLIDEGTSKGGAIAIKQALTKPHSDEPVVADVAVRNLPKPSEARDIARETGRFVAASDGRVYSGATEEEEAETVRVTGQTYGAIDAINLLAKLPAPAQWLSEAPHFQLRDLTSESVEKAATWLLDLATELEVQDGK